MATFNFKNTEKRRNLKFAVIRKQLTLAMIHKELRDNKVNMDKYSYVTPK